MAKKKILILLIILFCASLCSASIKWTKRRNWRRLKESMSIQQLEGILGEPVYTEKEIYRSTSYYTSSLPYIKIEGSKYRIKNKTQKGIIRYSYNKKLKRFIISGIVEPDFSKIKYVKEEKKREKLYRIKWRNKRNWRRLRRYMSERAVISILGEPTNIFFEHSTKRYVYGKSEVWGSVYIKRSNSKKRKNSLSSYIEPFWILLDEVEDGK